MNHSARLSPLINSIRMKTAWQEKLIYFDRLSCKLHFLRKAPFIAYCVHIELLQHLCCILHKDVLFSLRFIACFNNSTSYPTGICYNSLDSSRLYHFITSATSFVFISLIYIIVNLQYKISICFYDPNQVISKTFSNRTSTNKNFIIKC